MSTLEVATVDTYQNNIALHDDLNKKYKEVFAMTDALIKNRKQSRPINPKKIEECNRKLNIIKNIFDSIKNNMSSISPPKEKGIKFEVTTRIKLNELDKMISELSDMPDSQSYRAPNFHDKERSLRRTQSERELHKIESERKISNTKKEKNPPHPSEFPLILNHLTNNSGHPLKEYNGLLVDMQLNYTELYQKFLLISNQQSKVENSDIEYCINKNEGNQKYVCENAKV